VTPALGLDTVIASIIHLFYLFENLEMTIFISVVTVFSEEFMYNHNPNPKLTVTLFLMFSLTMNITLTTKVILTVTLKVLISYLIRI